MAKNPLVWTIVAVFALASLAPTVLAKEDRPDRSDRDAKDKDRDRAREVRDDVRDDRPRGERRAYNLTLSGNGVDRENATYTIELVGTIEGKVRFHDGNATHFKGRGILHGRLLDANGTVLKEGDLRVKMKAHEDADTGEWKWHLEAVKKRPKHWKVLNLRGDATEGEAGFDLVGHGKAVAKFDPDRRATPIKLDVRGTLVRA